MWTIKNTKKSEFLLDIMKNNIKQTHTHTLLLLTFVNIASLCDVVLTILCHVAKMRTE